MSNTDGVKRGVLWICSQEQLVALTREVSVKQGETGTGESKKDCGGVEVETVSRDSNLEMMVRRAEK